MEYVDLALQHWPFIAMAVVGMIFGQVLKTNVFSLEKAKAKGKFQWFWWWGYKLLALWPMLLGIIIGAIWHNPECAEKPWPVVASIMYFAMAGGGSVFLFQLLKGIAKQKGLYLEEGTNDGNNGSRSPS